MWSAGCILVEMILRQAIFAGENEEDQMAQIVRLFGNPIDSAPDPPLANAPMHSTHDKSIASCVKEFRAADLAADARDESLESLSKRMEAALASPLNNVWPGCNSLPGFTAFEAKAPQSWRSIIPASMASSLAVDLLSQLLVYDPDRRLSAEQALAHPWFSAVPLPLPAEHLVLPAKVKSSRRPPSVGKASR
jgi:serine/threonine protein kinase